MLLIASPHVFLDIVDMDRVALNKDILKESILVYGNRKMKLITFL